MISWSYIIFSLKILLDFQNLTVWVWYLQRDSLWESGREGKRVVYDLRMADGRAPPVLVTGAALNFLGLKQIWMDAVFVCTWCLYCGICTGIWLLTSGYQTVRSGDRAVCAVYKKIGKFASRLQLLPLLVGLLMLPTFFPTIRLPFVDCGRSTNRLSEMFA